MRRRFHLQWPWARDSRPPRKQLTGTLRQMPRLPSPWSQVSGDIPRPVLVCKVRAHGLPPHPATVSVAPALTGPQANQTCRHWEPKVCTIFFDPLAPSAGFLFLNRQALPARDKPLGQSWHFCHTRFRPRPTGPVVGSTERVQIGCPECQAGWRPRPCPRAHEDREGMTSDSEALCPIPCFTDRGSDLLKVTHVD